MLGDGQVSVRTTTMVLWLEAAASAKTYCPLAVKVNANVERDTPELSYVASTSNGE